MYKVKTEDLQKVISLTLTAEQLETIACALEMHCICLAEENDADLECAANAQEAIIDVFESNFGEDDEGYDCYQLSVPELHIKTNSDLPEHIELEYVTNGHQGGDSGHGGYTTLKIQAGSCGAKVSLTGYTDFEVDGGEEIEITVRGDWESSGFAEAFIALGKELLEKTKTT